MRNQRRHHHTTGRRSSYTTATTRRLCWSSTVTTTTVAAVTLLAISIIGSNNGDSNSNNGSWRVMVAAQSSSSSSSSGRPSSRQYSSSTSSSSSATSSSSSQTMMFGDGPVREPCNICLGGGLLTEPSAIIASIGTYDATCTTTQLVAGSTVDMKFTTENCDMANVLSMGVCGCPNERPGAADESSAILYGGDDGQDSFTIYCQLCPNSMPMEGGTGEIGGISCQDIYNQGQAGLLTPSECLAAQTRAALSDDICGCYPDGYVPPSQEEQEQEQEQEETTVAGDATSTAGAATDNTSQEETETTETTTTTTTTGGDLTQPDEIRAPCNLCGDGQGILSNGGAWFDETLGTTCADAQRFAFLQGMTANECLAAQALAIPICGCPPTSVVPAPALVGRNDETVFCTMCHHGHVTYSTNRLFDGGDTCALLEYKGRMNEFTLEQCMNYRVAAGSHDDDPCECVAAAEAAAAGTPGGGNGQGMASAQMATDMDATASPAVPSPVQVPSPTAVPTIPTIPIGSSGNTVGAGSSSSSSSSSVATTPEIPPSVGQCDPGYFQVTYTIWFQDPSAFAFDLSVLVDSSLHKHMHTLNPSPNYLTGVSCLPSNPLMVMNDESSSSSSSSSNGGGVGSFSGNGGTGGGGGANSGSGGGGGGPSSSGIDGRSDGTDNSYFTSSTNDGNGRRRRHLQQQQQQPPRVRYGSRLRATSSPAFFQGNLLEFTISMEGPSVDPNRASVTINQDTFDFVQYPESGYGGVSNFGQPDSIVVVSFDQTGIDCTFMEYDNGRFQLEQPNLCRFSS